MSIDFTPVIDTLTATRAELVADLARIDNALAALIPPVDRDEDLSGWMMVTNDRLNDPTVNDQFALTDPILEDQPAGYEQPDGAAAGDDSAAATSTPTDEPATDLAEHPDDEAATGQTRGGRTGYRKHDLSQIAMWIYSAKENGAYSVQALADRFDVPISVAKNWPGRCRADGYDIDPQTTAPAVLPDVDLAAVAATYRDAFAADRRPIQAIMDRFDIDRPTARDLVTAARAAQLLAARDEPPVHTEAPQQYVSHRASTK